MRIIHRTFDTLGCSTILIGRVGENHVTRLDIDVSGELVKYPRSVFEIMLKTPAFDEPYPLLVTLDGNSLYYDFSSSDLQSSGFGELEVLLCSPDGNVLKSATTRIRIDSSIITGRYPGPIEKILAELRAMIEEVKNAGIKTVTVLPDDPSDDEIVYLNAEDSGFYRWDGSDWVRLTDDGEGLETLANIVSDIGNRVGKIAVVEKYSELSEHEDALAAFVYGMDGGQKSFADYDPETDVETPLYVADSMAYDPSATVDSGVIIFDGTETEVALTLLPVYTSGTVDPVYGGLDMILETNETNPSAYMPVVATEFDEETRAQILEDYGITVPTGAEVTAFFAYSFEAISGYFVAEGTAISGTLDFLFGWNVVFVVEGEEMNVYTAAVTPNNYINIGTFDSWTQTEPNLNYLLDAVVLSEAVDKRGVYVKTNGEWVDPYRTDDSDDVTLLEFKNYASLVVRDDVINSDGIQDVPVYTGGVEEICRLTAGTDYIALQEVRNEISETVSGMPVRVLVVMLGGTSYYYVGAPWLLSDGTTVRKGWRNGNAPVIADFTPSSFIVNGTTYTASDTMPDEALSALRSLSQCVNVSADAMGAIRIPDDAVVRFAGNVEPNRKYYFTAIAGSEISFTLPTVPFTTDDAQFVIYLNCGNYVDLVFPNGTKFVGGTLPNSDAGSHKIIGCWIKDEGAWAIGGIDYSEVS